MNLTSGFSSDRPELRNRLCVNLAQVILDTVTAPYPVPVSRIRYGRNPMAPKKEFELTLLTESERPHGG